MTSILMPDNYSYYPTDSSYYTVYTDFRNQLNQKPKFLKPFKKVLLPLIALGPLERTQDFYQIPFQTIFLALLNQKNVKLYYNFEPLSQTLKSRKLLWKDFMDINCWSLDEKYAAFRKFLEQEDFSTNLYSNFFIQAWETDLVHAVKLVNGTVGLGYENSVEHISPPRYDLNKIFVEGISVSIREKFLCI